MGSLTIKDVRKSFSGVEILKGINLEIADGKFLILVGPSGCGKSTLLNMIAGLDDITSGDIIINNVVVNQLPPKDRDIAMVFQSYALYPNMSVKENIAFGLQMRKVAKTEQIRIIDEVAKILQIEHLLDRKPQQLSGGQRQRVAMGRALARKPALFLFDEPLSNLDAKLRVEMRAEIKRLHQRLATTIVYVTHDQVEAMTLGDVIAVMKEGEVQQFGSPQEIYEQPINQYVAGFIGSPGMNFIDVKLEEENGNAVVEINFGSKVGAKRINLNKISDQQRTYLGKNIVLGIRPELITDTGSAISHHKNLQNFNAEIDVIEPTGPDTWVYFFANNTRILARCHPKSLPPMGSLIELTLDPSSVLMFDKENGKRI